MREVIEAPEDAGRRGRMARGRMVAERSWATVVTPMVERIRMRLDRA
jgi:hypothetical protein